MKIPFINSNKPLLRSVRKVLKDINADKSAPPLASGEAPFDAVPVQTLDAAIEYINYQMPPLILMNFSDANFDAFEVMGRITEDPWLNHGAIIAVYTGNDTYTRINELTDSNLVVYLHHQDLSRQLGAVLNVVRSNQQILFQRALQTDLISSVAGEFVLEPDLMLVPAYANLVANYLFNVGFLAADAKSGVSLVLSEMLINAIEHGNCGISFREKREWMESHQSIHTLIKAKCKDPRVRARRVRYSYEIQHDRSRHVIRDEGTGFDWRSHLAQKEIDYLAESGRGILLARQHVHQIAYNEVGNEVTLEFRHRPEGTNIPGVLRDNEVLECKPGDTIMRQGEASDFLYYVAQGEYRVLVNGNHVANLTPADMLVGEMSLLLEETRSATVIANMPGRLIKISKQDFINIIKNQPYYGLFLSKLIAKRLHRQSRGLL